MSKEIKLFPYQNKFPKIGENVLLASGVKIIGDVEIGKDANIWYNAVIRGDVNYIKIGEATNIQDLSMLHVTGKTAPLNIGNKVTVGHNVILHGCTIEDLSLIGMGAVVLDNAVIEKNSFVAAGSVVKEKFRVPSGTLVAGVPAKVVRDLRPEEIEHFEVSAQNYLENAALIKEALIKNNIEE